MSCSVIGADVMFSLKSNHKNWPHNTANNRTVLSWCNQRRHVLPDAQKVGPCETLVTWWKDLSLGFNNPSKQERWICN